MKLKKLNQNGFTLAEVVITSAIMATLLGSIVGMLSVTMNAWKSEDMRSQVRNGVEKGMERLKDDVRLTDGSQILYYPSDASEFTAISMPYLTKDANGFFPQSNGAIDWSQAQTVIYHVQPGEGGTKELIRTTLDTFNASDSVRQAELDDIAVNGAVEDASTSNQKLASANNISLTVTPDQPTFDGYSASTTLSGLTSFGSIVLAAGNHTITFEVDGKNAASSGYRIGIDSISLTPSGGLQEVEALSMSASSGQALTSEDMSGYGAWGGNYQKEFHSTAEGDFVTFTTYYDQWLESNFSKITHDNTVVDGTDPHLTVLSREDQGLSPAWTASAETNDGASGTASYFTQSIRTVVTGANFTRSATLMRIKFMSAPGAALTIGSAYFGARDSSAADSPNFGEAPLQMYFDNDPVTVGDEDPVGAATYPGVQAGVMIPPNSYVWTNWFPYETTVGSVPNFLVSTYVATGDGATWTPDPLGAPLGFRVANDNASSQGDWTALAGYGTDTALFAIGEIATWEKTGTATSQVYDTKQSAPNFSQLSWTPTLPSNSTITFKARTSNSSTMVGASTWESLAALGGSPAGLGGIGHGRYVQFQAELTTGSPYTTYPSVDNVKLTWPGQTSIVQIAGHFTKRPNYGIFKVKVDGVDLSGALNVGIDVTSSDRGEDVNYSLHSQARPRNTGK